MHSYINQSAFRRYRLCRAAAFPVQGAVLIFGNRKFRATTFRRQSFLNKTNLFLMAFLSPLPAFNRHIHLHFSCYNLLRSIFGTLRYTILFPFSLMLATLEFELDSQRYKTTTPQAGTESVSFLTRV